jgi:hypothetical protein
MSAFMKWLLSDHEGDAELYTPQGEDGLVYGRASLEQQYEPSVKQLITTHVPLARLDGVVREDVSFVKVDVEGHELSVLHGAVGLIDRCQPVFLVEAEDRHRAEATRSVFDFFRDKSYRGFFLSGRRGDLHRSFQRRGNAGRRCAVAQWWP